MDTSNQFIEGIQDIVDKATERFKQGEDVEQKDKIPLADIIPLESNVWWRIEDVVCVSKLLNHNALMDLLEIRDNIQSL